jgi:DNA-binding SARP family transcriptional activator
MLITDPPGYRLAATRDQLDTGRFEDLVAAARKALSEDDPGLAVLRSDEAIGLWRGPALGDVPRGPQTATVADRLDELRLDAMELRLEAALSSGAATELVADLRGLTDNHPLRERFWLLLMRALDNSGRPAEALAAYADARRILAEELGTEPGPCLQQYYLGLLAAEPGGPAAGAAVGTARPDPPAVIPRQLPGAVANFVGRTAELCLPWWRWPARLWRPTRPITPRASPRSRRPSWVAVASTPRRS